MKILKLWVACACVSLNSLSYAQQAYYDVTPGDGYGLRFWQSDLYKIHMGNSAEYHFGPVTDYSVKMNMSDTPGRGWTWGIAGQIPVAALNKDGNMQVAGIMTLGTYSSATTTGGLHFAGWRDTSPDYYFGASIEAEPSWVCCSGYPNGGYAGVKHVNLNFNFHNPADWGPGAKITAMKILSNGNVGIGTPAPDTKLTVKGVIHTSEVLVDVNVPGPDYVFEKDYSLLPLKDLEAYIFQNKHLPEVPSAKEMETNGLQLKEMNLLLLKKVEEMTLHLIEMKKENEAMKTRLDKLEDK